MTVAIDKSSARSDKQHTESATGRVGDDVQRAKENISEAAASARDDIAADLRRLNGAADIVRNGSRQQIVGTVAVAVLIGWVLGRRF